MPPTPEKIDRLVEALRLETNIIAVYDSETGDAFEPTVGAKGRTCCFAYYKRWMKGTTLVIERGAGGFDHPMNGCPGAQAAFGFMEEYPPFMAHFLTDGEGAPMGEGLKATPELAQEFLDRARPRPISSDAILIGPLRVEQWDSVRSVTFFADPDRISALMTLAAFRSSGPDFIHAPFSSGCGLMLRELENQERERAVLGCTDIAMRKHIPPEILCLTVPPGLFEQMVDFPDGAFLNKEWWNELMQHRGKNKRR
jgi:hypothetical protein